LSRSVLKYSFVIPAYNEEKSISKVIQSVLEQSNKDFELIVVDNGSTDKTREIIKSYPEVKYVYESRRNRSIARNSGASSSSGRYICFVDADVTLDKHWLKACDTYLEEVPLDFLATQIRPVCDRKNNIVDSYRTSFSCWKSDGLFISLKKAFGFFPVINTAACVIERESFELSGRFNEKLNRNEDLELSLRMLSKGYFLGGTTSAVAEVNYLGEVTDFSRTFNYILRFFKVSSNAMWNHWHYIRMNYQFVLHLFSKKKMRLAFFALVIEMSSLLGSLYKLVFQKQGTYKLSLNAGRKVLVTSYNLENKTFLLKKHILIMYLNDFALVSDEINWIKFVKRSKEESMIWKKLINSSALDENEAQFMTQTGFFFPT
jgi:glycosyltransferase involved in cell wall biosynthesis